MGDPVRYVGVIKRRLNKGLQTNKRAQFLVV